jgi:hypothetical protein
MGKVEGDGTGVGGWLFGKGVGGPLLFGDVGSQAKDLVYKGFVAGHMLMISCLGPVGSTLTSTASITQDITVGIVSASFQDGNTKHDLSFDTAGSQVYCFLTSLAQLLRIDIVWREALGGFCLDVLLVQSALFSITHSTI